MDEKTENIISQPQKTSLLKKFKRFLVTTAFILLNLTVIFYFTAEPILRYVLKNSIAKKSEGLYSLDFDDIELSLWNRSLSLTNFTLHPDTLIYQQLKSQGKVKTALYEIRLQELRIHRIGLYRLIKNKSLNINAIEIDKPEIQLISTPQNENKKEKYDAIHKDLYPAISKYLTELNVDTISIRAGVFNLFIKKEHSQTATSAENISISLFQFRLNENSFQNRKQLFYSKNIEVKIRGYKLTLNEHLLTAKEVRISTKDSLILVKNVMLSPTVSQKDSLKMFTFYDILIPEIKISAADVNAAYFEKKIKVKNILLNRPRLKIFALPKPEKPTKLRKDTIINAKEFDLYKIFAGKITSLEFENFALKNGNFDIYQDFSLNNSIYSLTGFSMELNDFLVDSTAKENKTKILYANDISLKVNRLVMKLKDKMHVLQTDTLFLSTKEKLISSQNIRLTPTAQAKWLAFYQKKKILNIFIPQIKLIGVNLKSVYNQSVMPISQFLIQNPKIDIQSFAEENISKKKKQKFSADNLYAMISPYLKSVFINELTLQNADIHFENKLRDSVKNYFSGNISLVLQKFLLSPHSKHGPDKLFYADSIEIEVKNYEMKIADNLHILHADRAFLSTKKSILSLDNLKISPIFSENKIAQLKKNNKSTFFDVKVRNVSLLGASIHNAYFDKYLKINVVNISQPQIRIEKFVDVKKNLQTDSVKIDSAKIENNSDDFFKMLSNYLQIIDIQRLTLDSGYVEMTKKDSLEQRLTFFHSKIFADLRKFYLKTDSVEENQNLFFSENIKIRANEFFDEMPNKIYDLRIGEIEFSTNNSEATVKSFFMIPKIPAADSLRKPTIFNVYFPVIKIKGIDIKKIYKDKMLNINEITVQNPAIAIIKRPKFITWFENDALEKQIKIKIPKGLIALNINELNIENGKAKFFNQISENNIFEFSKTDISGKIEKFHLDSAFFDKDGNNVLTFDNVNLHLKNYFTTTPDSIHFVKIDEVKLFSKKGEAELKNFRIEYDSTKNAFKTLKTWEKALLYKIKIAEGKLFGVDFNKFYKTRHLQIAKTDFKKMEWFFVSYPELRKPNTPNLFEANFYDKIRKNLSSLLINDLQFEKTMFSYTTISPDTTKYLTLERISGNIYNFFIDSLGPNRPKKFLYADEMSIKFDNFQFRSPFDSLYVMKAKELKISTAKSTVWASDFLYEPQFEFYDFSKILGVEKGAMKITIPNLTAERFDIRNFLEKKHNKIGKIFADSLLFHYFQDKNFPQDSNYVPKNPIHQIVNGKNYLRIDTIQAKNSRILYEYLPKKSPQKAFCELTKMQVNIFNLTNDTILIRDSIITEIQVQGYVMDRGFLKTNLRIPLNSPNGRHFLSGSVDTMDFHPLNSLTQRMSKVSIISGYLNGLTYEIEADDYKAVGTMQFRYKNLEVALLETEEGDSTVKNRIFLSFIGNAILPSSNPRRIFLREGIIYQEQNYNQSIYSYWLNSLMSGLKSSVGFDSKEQKKLRNQPFYLKLQEQQEEKAKSDYEMAKRLREKMKEENEVQQEIQKQIVKEQKRKAKLERQWQKNYEKERKRKKKK